MQPGLNTATTPAELADLWCLRLTRRRFGLPRDNPQDIRFEFENMVEMGFTVEELRLEILRPGRDRSEHFWQFRERLKASRAQHANGAGRPTFREMLAAATARRDEERKSQ